jgi:hypothetical protein
MATSDCLFGTPILVKQRISILCGDRKMAVTQDGAQLKETLCVVTATTIMLGETKYIKVKPSNRLIESPLASKQTYGIVEGIAGKGDNITIAEGLVHMQDSTVELPITNNEDKEMHLDQGLVIANLGRTDFDQFIDIGGYLRKFHDAGSNMLPTCPCLSKEAKNKIIICNEYGITKMGPKWQRYVNFKVKATSRILKDKMQNVIYLIPGKDESSHHN